MTVPRFDIATLVDPSFATDWYPVQGLPPALKQRLNGQELRFSLEDFACEIPHYQQRLCRDLARAEVPYAPAHGHTHASRIVWAGKEALELLQQLIGTRLPLGFVQRCMWGLARHDWKHPGAAYVELALPQHQPVLPGGLSGHPNDYTVEYLTSVWQDEENERECPEDIAGRGLETYLTWASTTRPPNDFSRRLGVDNINPQGFIGCLMAAVDVKPTRELTYTLQFELDLLCVEATTIGVPTSREEYLAGRQAFLSYIVKRFDALDEAARQVARSAGVSSDFSLTSLLGWRDDLAVLKRQLHQLLQGDSEAWAIFNSLMILRGATPI